MDPDFKKMVDAYDQPRAGNLVNSVRIQALSEAVAAGNDASVWTAVSELDELDLSYLSDVDGSKAFWDQARDKLSLTTYAALYFRIAGTAPTQPAQGDTYTVIAGDNLSRIADRMLGDSARWRELYKLNRAEIGDDPDHLTSGQQLKLPAL